jgi:hypothetical protein
MEPLQEKAAEIITQLEEKKKSMAQTQEECTTIIQEEVTMQALEVLTKKYVQVMQEHRQHQASVGESATHFEHRSNCLNF